MQKIEPWCPQVARTLGQGLQVLTAPRGLAVHVLGREINVVPKDGLQGGYVITSWERWEEIIPQIMRSPVEQEG